MTCSFDRCEACSHYRDAVADDNPSRHDLFRHQNLTYSYGQETPHPPVHLEMKDLNGEKRHVALMKGENENDGPIPANYMYCLSPPSLFGDC